MFPPTFPFGQNINLRGDNPHMGITTQVRHDINRHSSGILSNFPGDMRLGIINTRPPRCTDPVGSILC